MRESFLKYFIYKKVHERNESLIQEFKKKEEKLRKEKVRKYKSIYQILDDEGKAEFRIWLLSNKDKLTEKEMEYILE